MAVNALIKHARKLPQVLYKPLTWDRGHEMAAHKRFTLAADIKVYFCDPQNPWQGGTNENTNCLLPQHFPKGVDISGYSQARLNAVARKPLHYPEQWAYFVWLPESRHAMRLRAPDGWGIVSDIPHEYLFVAIRREPVYFLPW